MSAALSMRVIAGGIRTHFYVEGSGSPVVFVHGGGLGSNASSWLHTMHGIARHRRAYAPDIAGYGKSEAPGVTYDGELILRQLTDLLDVLCLDRVLLVGHSMGATVVARLAVRMPERVKAAVMVAPGGGALGLRYHSDGHAAMERVRARPTRGNVRAMVQLMHAGEDAPEAEVEERLAYAARPGHLEALRAYASSSKSAPAGAAEALAEALRVSPVPLMLAWGRLERFNPPELGDRIAETLPNLARYAVFDHAGHDIHHDEPVTFGTTLNAFFDEVEAHV